MTDSIRALLGLPARVGRLVTAPDDALARADADGGGMRDALALVAAAVVAFRMPELVHAVLTAIGPTSGGVMRLLALFADEVRHAAWFVLPAAVAVTVLARARRDAGRDLDLAAACYPAPFVIFALERGVSALTGPRVIYGSIASAAAAVWTAVLAWRAVRVARARPPAAPKTAAPETTPAGAQAPIGGAPAADAAPPVAPMPRSARAVGGAVGALAVALAVHGAIWSAHNVEALRPIERGQLAPVFALDRIDGTPGTVALDALRGQVVVLDFWATWCPPCVEMIPVMDGLARDWAPRGVSFLGVNSDGGGATPDQIRAFLAAHPFSYPVVRDEGDVGALYRVENLPSIFVIGRDGGVRASFVGFTMKGTLEKVLRDATGAR
jgi:thiol-disulfide isomerase/thioredoxin